MDKDDLVERISQELQDHPDLSLEQRAGVIARIAFEDTRRISGAMQMEHIKGVVEDVRNMRYASYRITIAYLHDILKKTPLTSNDLRSFEIPNMVIIALEDLRPRYNEVYFASTERAFKNELARPIKISDNRRNMDRDRMPEGKEISGKFQFNYDYRWPLSIAFGEAIENGLVDKHTPVCNFLHSPHCPDNLRYHDWYQHIIPPPQ